MASTVFSIIMRCAICEAFVESNPIAAPCFLGDKTHQIKGVMQYAKEMFDNKKPLTHNSCVRSKYNEFGLLQFSGIRIFNFCSED